ncbi:hypothetical protein EYW49_16600 [Siculibacillus lacustris]|uniref:Uncharacterized protein n=1 Tax=Siculibacillus lacustris TaxID=1549641 RepID=A0A4Q9VKN6_9HYPH|nr:hypothetical protein [Siculibacillus lacustris]TBW35069.1 hypothetical protein EYW49_16600 [Siculibacillus lacustris]
MITVKLDVSGLTAGLKRLSTDLRSQLAGAVTSAARAGRTDFYRQAQSELHLRARDIRASQSIDFIRASPATLKSTFTPSTKSSNMADTGISWTRPGGLTALTHVVTKGSKTFSRGFIIKGKAVHRTGSARNAIKSLRTTKPSTLMSQEDAPARIAWETTTTERLNQALPVAVERAIAKAGF